MNFPDEVWALPEKELEFYVKKYGGNPFCLRLDGTALGYDLQDPILNWLRGKLRCK